MANFIMARFHLQNLGYITENLSMALIGRNNQLSLSLIGQFHTVLTTILSLGIHLEGIGANKKAEIAFDNGAIKTLILRFAQLELLDE